MRYFERLMAEVFKAEGAEHPEKLAKAACETLQLSGLVDTCCMNRFERDAAIYTLKGSNVEAPELMRRFSASRRTVYRAVKRQLTIRKRLIKAS